jgi:hypothetical protein
MKKLLVCILCWAATGGVLKADINVTAPSSRDEVKSCSEYSDEMLLDRWDMNERTDLGWRIYNSYELPLSYLSNISFADGIFSAVSAYTPGMSPPLSSDVNISILDSAYPNAVVIGKTGKKYPICANKYTILVMRMYLEPDIEGQLYGQGYLFWSKNTMYQGVTTSYPFSSRNGWFIYFIDIPSLGIISGDDPWSGWIDSLRMDPISISNKEIKIDWIRLVKKDLSTQRTISWSGAGGDVDIFLDDDNNSSNGNLGFLAKNVAGSSYPFLTGGLAPGNYYVAVAPAGTSTFSYSPGYYHVNDTPILKMDKPSGEGSDVDFATVTFSDPWDMSNSADVEHTIHVINTRFKTINSEDLAGRSFANQTVFYGKSELSGSAWGDPIVYFLNPWYGERVPAYSIDTNKYHNLVFKMSIAGTYSYNDGSIARVIWKREDETQENVSKDIVIKHFADRWLMNKIVCDLKTIPLADGAGSPSHSGWTGSVNAFRIDPHEFPDSRAFVFDDVKITADWTADLSFSIEWSIEDSQGCSLFLYYDTDSTGYDGVLIASGIPVSQGKGSHVWNTSSVPEGKYWIYGGVSDGTNQNRSYSTGPVIIDHNLIPELSLSKKRLYFGSEMTRAVTSKETVVLENTGQGALNWQAATNNSWINVSPTSGTGERILEIEVDPASLSPGVYSGSITVTDLKAWNSPQVIEVFLTVYALGSDSAPFGYMDTPLDGADVYGSVPVTGWGLDDVEVTKVEIKRAPHSSDSPVVIGPDGLVYLGDAVFVRGARTDIESGYPTCPKADRAGWGYMMLSHFLPNHGNGTFTLYAVAYDGSGHRVELGRKVIHSDNANSVTPFGTIDTPEQGGVVSGVDYVNFGWALTPQPKYIPYDGSTIWVWVDGVPEGHPVYNNYRADIATLFPGYANSDGAVGYYNLDTTGYANGVHNIAWSVEDNKGEACGIGSRYFEVQNVGGALGDTMSFDLSSLQVDTSGRFGLRVSGMERGYHGRKVEGQEQGRRRMMSEGRSGMLELVRQREDGAYEVEVEELERIELHFRGEGGNRFIGWGEDTSRPLPVGSTFDEKNGVFSWSLGPGFLGRHVLHFAVTDGLFTSQPIKIIFNISPKKFPLIK